MPLDFGSSVLISTFLTGVLSALAYRRNVLTWDGSLAAFVVGMIIGVFGDVTWLFLLLFFLLSSFLATRYRFALKEAMGVQEGVRGERRASNVLANGAALMAVAGGRFGTRRSCIRDSTSVRPPFLWLHERQAATTFSQVCCPPR